MVALGDLGVYASVQRIRCRDASEVVAMVDDVRALMRATGKTVGSWWLSDRTTPATTHDLLLEHGLFVVEGNYDIGGLALVGTPPAAPRDVEARRIASLEEHVAAALVAYEAFATPLERRLSRDALEREFGELGETDAYARYGAWIEGRLVATGYAYFGPRGALLGGGSTLPAARGRGAYRALVRARWDDAVARGTPALVVSAGPHSEPILRRLGFVEACRFRRLEDAVGGDS